MADTLLYIGIFGIPLWIWFSYSQGFWGSLVGFSLSALVLTVLGMALANGEYSESSLFEFIGLGFFTGVVWGGIVFIGIAVLAGMAGASSGGSGGTGSGLYAYECRVCGWYQERAKRRNIYKCPGCGRKGGIIPSEV
nr:hypothetical protein [Yoonia sp.]